MRRMLSNRGAKFKASQDAGPVDCHQGATSEGGEGAYATSEAFL